MQKVPPCNQLKYTPYAPAAIREVIGRNALARRKFLGLNQKQVAEACGYDRRWLSSVEKGDSSIRLEFLPQLAEVLQLVDPLILLVPDALNDHPECGSCEEYESSWLAAYPPVETGCHSMQTDYR